MENSREVYLQTYKQVDLVPGGNLAILSSVVIDQNITYIDLKRKYWRVLYILYSASLSIWKFSLKIL